MQTQVWINWNLHLEYTGDNALSPKDANQTTNILD